MPIEHDLDNWLLIFLGKLQQSLILCWINPISWPFIPTNASHRCIGNRSDVFSQAESNKFQICDLKIDFNLVDGRWNFGICEEVPKKLSVKIWQANAFCKSFSNKCFQIRSKLVQWSLWLSIVAGRSVNQVQIYVVQLKHGQRFLDLPLNISVCFMPNLGCDIQSFPLFALWQNILTVLRLSTPHFHKRL